ncbi:MAG TPA: thymidylate kinase-like protein [Nitrospiraceae bacterium]|nr:thymidylate kinase-like protein [Nitrospiraceae bacterium]
MQRDKVLEKDRMRQAAPIVLSDGVLASNLFRLFEKEGICYVLVGDSREYPAKILSDVDVVIEPECVSKLVPCLMKFCDLYNLKLIQILQHEQSAWFFVCSWTGNDGKHHVFYPDVCTDYVRWGRRFLGARCLLSGRIRKQVDADGQQCSFFVPAPEQAFIYYLLKKIDKGFLAPSHQSYLSGEWKKAQKESKKQLKKFWKEPEVEMLCDAAESNSWNEVCDALPRLRVALRENLPFSFKSFALDVQRKILRIMKPTGVHVVLLGPDGSGKSTILECIEGTLASAFRRTKRYHLRPFFGSPQHAGEPEPNPHGKPVRGFLPSLIKLGVWWIDYTIGYFISVFPFLVRSTLVLFDRYYFDLAIDPRRYRYGGPLWLAKLCGKFIPRPDLVILLDVPAEELYSRKAEVSVEESHRQRLAYREFVGTLTNGHIIDNSDRLEETIQKVEAVVLNYMAIRAISSLGHVKH